MRDIPRLALALGVEINEIYAAGEKGDEKNEKEYSQQQY